MSKKKFTEKELLESMTHYNSHSGLLAKTKLPFDDVESISDDFMANRIGEPSSNLVNSNAFLSYLKIALNSLPDGDIELCDLGNEIGRVIANLNSPHKTLLREVVYGIEHGFDLISKERGASNE